MADELTVGHGGGSRVAVDALFAEAARLGALAGACGGWCDRIRTLRHRLIATGVAHAPGVHQGGAPLELLHAVAVLDRAVVEAEGLRNALITAAERYGYTERLVTGLWDFGARFAAAHLGLATRLLWPMVLAAGLRASGALLAATRSGGVDPKPAARRVLTDPGFIRGVRAAGGSVDELLLSAAGVPPIVALGLGAGLRAPQNARLTVGVTGALGALGSRLLAERPVTVQRLDVTGSGPSAGVMPPRGLGELARRVPAPAAGAPQIRIERYGPPEAPRWVVYVTGTITSSPVADEEPLDTTSDVYGVAEYARIADPRSAGAADRAARDALAAAGARPGEPILPVGYSAGGIVAANLVRDPSLNVVGAVNLGGPVASAALGEVPVLSLEHEEDLIPAIGGANAASPGLTTVRRSALAGEAIAPESVLPAHELARYLATADLVDRSESPELRRFGALVRDFTGETPGERSDWRATRVTNPGEDARPAR